VAAIISQRNEMWRGGNGGGEKNENINGERQWRKWPAA
jgi:hypothetical protein